MPVTHVVQGAGHSPLRAKNQLAPATILIVDDEPANRKLMETLLRPEGYTTITAATGAEALLAIDRSAPDLILLDIMMPGIDGFAIAQRLKASQATSRIPIIMVTALVDRGARLAGLGSGAEEFLTKPVDRAELWLRVRNLLRLKSLSDFQETARQEIRDINAGLEERVRQRTAQLQEANAELEAFSYSVSHDLRTPLNSIAGFTDLLGKEICANPASGKTTHYLERIRAGAHQMGELIDGLLSLAHVSRAKCQWESVDLSAIAQTVMDGCREREPGRAAKIDIQPGLTAQGDRRLLRQVLENLLGNAWKFTARQPETWIDFHCESAVGGTGVFVVRDNGAGFDMAYSNKLFGAFQRLHTASDFPGTGIGLATVRRIVARHGGKIRAESAAGSGASFFFTLGLRANTGDGAGDARA